MPHQLASLVSQSDWEHAWKTEAAGRPAEAALQTEPSVVGLSDAIRPLIAEPRRVVEIGAAGGKTLSWLRQTFPDARAVGLDFSLPGLLLTQRSLGESHGPNPFDLVAARFEQPPFLPHAFDLAASFGLLEHFVGPARVDCFAAHVHLIAPGGAVLVTVPNRDAFVYRTYQLIAGFICRRLPRVARAVGVNFVKEEPLTADELYHLADHTDLVQARVFESDGRNDWRRLTVDRVVRGRQHPRPEWRRVPRDERRTRRLRGRTLALVARVV